jgi:16S rRNA (uracil1498-N3)-methyltransferase
LTPRLHVPGLLPSTAALGLTLALPPGPARHAQVLRLQPGSALALFDSSGGQWQATVAAMGRKDVSVTLGHFEPGDPLELLTPVTLAVGMPANDRMDALVEKATELGVSAIQPLMTSRSVLRLDGERAAKKVAHWQSVAEAAAEQSGRTRVPTIHPVSTLKAWLPSVDASWQRGVLSFEPTVQAAAWVQQRAASGQGSAPLVFLSGPEGGLAPEETSQCTQLGWTAVGLGPRVLRADTAPLMALSLVAALGG